MKTRILETINILSFLYDTVQEITGGLTGDQEIIEVGNSIDRNNIKRAGSLSGEGGRL